MSVTSAVLNDVTISIDDLFFSGRTINGAKTKKSQNRYRKSSFIIFSRPCLESGSTKTSINRSSSSSPSLIVFLKRSKHLSNVKNPFSWCPFYNGRTCIEASNSLKNLLKIVYSTFASCRILIAGNSLSMSVFVNPWRSLGFIFIANLVASNFFVCSFLACSLSG